MPTTRLVEVDPDRPDPAILAEAAAILRGGGLVAFATETVYGLGADATNPEAVARIFAAKGRPSTNPLIVHVPDLRAANPYIESCSGRVEGLAANFWPGPLTMILPRTDRLPDLVTAGQPTVGIRVPEPAIARSLIAVAGIPIAAPSANRSTGVSPTTAGHVRADLEGQVDLILDSGPTPIGIESTVLDLSGDRPLILRPGWITAEQIAGVLGEPIESTSHAADASTPMASPGQMSVHYAPTTPALRVERDQLIALPRNTGPYSVIVIGPPIESRPDDPTRQSEWVGLYPLADATRRLYQTLREHDAMGQTFLLIVMPPDSPEWRAIRDRVQRATRPWDGRSPLP